MKLDSFAVFILSHGRPDTMDTIDALARHGYSGKAFILIDDEDRAAARYQERFPGQVIIFNKKKIAERFDEADNFNSRKTVFYARNACFEIASGMGLDYFLQLDDDYRSFDFKFDTSMAYGNKPVRDLDSVFSLMVEFLRQSGALSVAMAQSGDYIGGWKAARNANIRGWRKCMNTFFCSTRRSFAFTGKINEDVSTYVLQGSRGGLFLTVQLLSITQRATQSNPQGMTDIYQDGGTYIKSFYSVMQAPSCVKVGAMGGMSSRPHHHIDWPHAVPVIVPEEFKKSSI